jgi:hypothetical protein
MVALSWRRYMAILGAAPASRITTPQRLTSVPAGPPAPASPIRASAFGNGSSKIEASSPDSSRSSKPQSPKTTVIRHPGQCSRRLTTISRNARSAPPRPAPGLRNRMCKADFEEWFSRNKVSAQPYRRGRSSRRLGVPSLRLLPESLVAVRSLLRCRHLFIRARTSGQALPLELEIPVIRWLR